LFPAPTITVTGTKFEMTGVPDNSAFQILASTTGYHPTYSPTVSVESSDISDFQAPAASNAFVTALASGFSVTPAAGKGVLMLHLLDAQGTPRAGVGVPPNPAGTPPPAPHIPAAVREKLEQLKGN